MVDISPNQDGAILKEILKEGTSEEKPGNGDKVSVHYVGTFEDGSEFDSSRGRNEKFEFDLGKGSVIRGWDIGVATMKRGELAKFTVKSDYAYGKSGSPPQIPGGATLIFEVELFDWKGEDLTKEKDGGIQRSIIEKGQGYTSPNKWGSVQIDLTGYYNDAVFDQREVDFVLGEGETKGIICGLEIALKKFKKGEKSRLKIKPKYGYGSTGCPDKNIPPNADLVYDIKLKEFEKAKDSWELDGPEKLEQSELLKTKGTNYFKEGNYKIATGLYKRVIDFLKDETDMKDEAGEKRQALLVAAHLNVAMCALKVNNHFEARKHCNEAMTLSPKNVKGLFRRGQASFALQDYDDALADFKTVLEIEPNNKAAKNQLVLCQQKIKQIKDSEKKKYAGMFQKFADSDAKKEKRNYPGDSLDHIEGWDNKMAKDMLPLDKEAEAFGEKPPEAKYDKEQSENEEQENKENVVTKDS